MDWVRLIGTSTAQPNTAIITNILRHMVMNRMNKAASMPAYRTISFSVVLHNGMTQANNPLPRGGGECISSACFSFGA